VVVLSTLFRVLHTSKTLFKGTLARDHLLLGFF
jgi:hypothetical protein